jgi:hypothetical protein
MNEEFVNWLLILNHCFSYLLRLVFSYYILY